MPDTQLGMFTGLLFAVVGMPLAHYADRGNRVKLPAIAVDAWSLMIGLSAATTRFAALAPARAGVAIGESGCNLCIQSLLADCYPPNCRGIAQGFLVTAVPLSGLAAFMLGGVISQSCGWRAEFVVAAILGILHVPLVQ